ncbi:hypothetical protein FNF27_03899 [Cafeteria roenbergensis]|uniref:Uncharacterized protein n=1 Tax=Cafeteria roenbergensis TaxID=33653 RepID=A0A5A8DIW5_CAFRO|nr:hypothetical protein FNF29_01601 [Cafeteria roenbergensis]KAA0163771.1 hypothetical protein FNF31_02625 [Cafeteria roenbergensis]KAA0171347.1 hypothetical protein FNF28_00838 [Cafeteria roenbergensis]KAA0174525.1 hypothetical protein FNF27_03899 [Cafeteria roenbergensis]|eukprot:KAA0155686.1 hypothetical protein FNF29_01601 [Cafeteria roenbergensis]
MAGSFSGFIPKLSASAELVWMGLKPFAAAGFAVLVGERMAAYKVSKAHHGHGHEHGHGHGHEHGHVAAASPVVPAAPVRLDR